jgi:hypothetical protein
VADRDGGTSRFRRRFDLDFQRNLANFIGAWKTTLAVSIFHIGLPLDHPSVPIEERPKIAKRLSDLRERMTVAGYKYEIIHASPATGLDDFKRQLRTQPCDGVPIGSGAAGDPAMTYFMEQIIDATFRAATVKERCTQTSAAILIRLSE